MKILMVHKFYYIEGGAERYVFNLTDLLEQKGHEVIPFAMENPRNFKSPFSKYFVDYFSPDQLVSTRNLIKKIKIAARTVFNKNSQKKLAQLIKDTKPDIAHVHSIYHHLTPSVLQTLKQFNIPVMMTLHDYKIICPNYILLDGKRNICKACSGKYFWKATAKKCFRDSYSASVLVSLEAYINYWKKCYRNNIDLFVAPSRFLGEKIQQYGYASKNVLIQPYTLDINSYVPNYTSSDYFVFMGRLTHEKGVNFLLDSMHHIQGARLYILGTGPLEEEMGRRIEDEDLSNVKMLGYQNVKELREIVSNAQFTVITSEWHDNSPLVIYESLTLGKPVIGSRMGGIPELIEEGKDGFTFERGDLPQFVKHVNTLIKDEKLRAQMSYNARKKAERLFAFDQHYLKIMELYQKTTSISNKL